MPMLHVEIFPCNAFCMNSYLVWCDSTREALIVDPGYGSESEWLRVKRKIDAENLQLRYVLLTHSHADHCIGSAYPGIDVSGSRFDEAHLPPVSYQTQMFGLDGPLRWLPIANNLQEGARLDFAGQQVEVIDCPGHSFSGLCYYLPLAGLLFSGDVLFCASVGRSDFGEFMGCNGRLLAESIVQKLLTLPAEVIVYPGHGPQTTIGYESKYNPYL